MNNYYGTNIMYAYKEFKNNTNETMTAKEIAYLKEDQHKKSRLKEYKQDFEITY